MPAALLVLAGCSDPQPANDTLPTAGSTSASPTLEPLGPADFPVPDEAREQTEAGAEAMASYYLDLVDYYYATLPTGPTSADWLQNLSQGCELCDYYANLYSSWRDRGYRYEGGDVSIESFGQVVVTSTTADVPLFVQVGEGRLFDGSGTEIESDSTPAMRQSGGLAFTWDAGRAVWSATQVNLVEVPQ